MKNKWLPVIAVLAVAVAGIVLFAVPKGGKEKPAQASSGSVDEQGNLVILEKDLSADQVTFVRYPDESGIEVLAVKDESGTVRVALGTCQSCNGSPGAYYTQEGDLLQCHNCGLTFPLSVIGTPRGGCNPIGFSEEVITRQEDGVLIDGAVLLQAAPLFSVIEAH